VKKYHTVSMHLTPQAGPGSSVLLDGVEVKGLISVKVETAVGTMTTVTLTFYAEVQAEAIAEVHS
jgi:hypothetical protein